MNKKKNKPLRAWKSIAVLGAILSSVFLTANAQADKLAKSNEQASVNSLSVPLQQLLKQEMQGLQQGLLALQPAYISGDWQQVAEIAMKMKNSYILKQQITPAQNHELHTKLPQAFINKDKEFHYFAGMLSHVADQKKTELIGFYLEKLTSSCMGCHASFATEKFSHFKQHKASNTTEKSHQH